MSRIIPLVAAMLVNSSFGRASLHASLTAGIRRARAWRRSAACVVGLQDPGALSDPSSMGNASSVPSLRSNAPVITVPRSNNGLVAGHHSLGIYFGDFPGGQMQSLIETHFRRVPSPGNP